MKTQRRPLSPEEQSDADRLKKIWDEKSRELSLTQLSVSKTFGFANQSAISQYLNARIPLNLETAAKFSKVLNVPLADISPRHAESLVTQKNCTGCSIAVSVPSGSEVIEADRLAQDTLGDCRWYVLNPADKTIDTGAFLMEVGGSPRLVKIEACEGGFRLIGASPKPAIVTPEIASLLPIKGRVLYKITKV